MGVVLIPISDEMLERFLVRSTDAHEKLALAMEKIAVRVDEHAEKEQSNHFKVTMSLLTIITGLLGFLGWLKFTGAV